MSYDLYIGDQTYSSWSLRGWLMFEKFDIPYRSHLVGLYEGQFAEEMAALAPARTVPTMRLPEGQIISDTFAMAETLAERHPDAGLWPQDAGERALARWLVAEMHAGFGALRSDCPMQLVGQYQGFAVSPAVRADLQRLEELWAAARAQTTTEGPWLFGKYSLADVFYAPIAARIAGYDLPVSEVAHTYVATHLTDPSFRAWRAEGALRHYETPPYQRDLPLGPWPG